MTLSDLGHCSKVIVNAESTVIVKDDVETTPEIAERVSQLREALKITKKKHDKEFILSRIASLTGGVGVIYVGGKTDLEQKELYERVDDAVCAVRSALEEGILPGGGTALVKAVENMDNSAAGKILSRALRAPFVQICDNAGIPSMENVDNRGDFSHGYNVKTNEWGDMYKMGVIDPMKVTKCALQNAGSVAVTLLSTNAIITMARTYEEK